MSCPFFASRGYASDGIRLCYAAYLDTYGKEIVDYHHYSTYCERNDAKNSKGCPVFTKKKLHSPEDFKSRPSACYVTTAVCRNSGKPDDCYELTTFRRFRDEWLSKEEDGQSLIKEYYENAPRIVDKIDSSGRADEIYNMIQEKYLDLCLKYIEHEEYKKCKECYVNMMHDLYEMEPTL